MRPSRDLVSQKKRKAAPKKQKKTKERTPRHLNAAHARNLFFMCPTRNPPLSDPPFPPEPPCLADPQTPCQPITHVEPTVIDNTCYTSS